MKHHQQILLDLVKPCSVGGIQTVMANDSSDSNQIKLIRSHLQSEAEKLQNRTKLLTL